MPSSVKADSWSSSSICLTSTSGLKATALGLRGFHCDLLGCGGGWPSASPSAPRGERPGRTVWHPHQLERAACPTFLRRLERSPSQRAAAWRSSGWPAPVLRTIPANHRCPRERGRRHCPVECHCIRAASQSTLAFPTDSCFVIRASPRGVVHSRITRSTTPRRLQRWLTAIVNTGIMLVNQCLTKG